APVAHSVRSSSWSRSLDAAAMTAWTSAGARPSGGCQRLLVDLTVCPFGRESNPTRTGAGSMAVFGADDRGSLMAVEPIRSLLSLDWAPASRQLLEVEQDRVADA